MRKRSLFTAKPSRANNARSATRAREPLDWYCEDAWPVEALLTHVPFRGLVYDPACGRGNIPSVFAAAGFETLATDIVDRGFEGARQLDFLGAASVSYRVPNIVCNPPYSYQDGIAEAFVRRALEIVSDRVAMLLPIKWQASIGRYRLFAEFPPEVTLIFSERPSMPPGSKIEALGRRAFKGGTMDYMWVVWRKGHQGPSPTVWIPPRPEAMARRERRHVGRLGQ